MSDASVMQAELKDRAGKGAARATRRAGRVPCVVYGAKKSPVLISVDPRDVMKDLHAGSFFSTVYDIEIEGVTKERVLPRDVQFHPVTDTPQHVDFLRVSAATQVTVEVTCNFLNEEESVGLKRGGVLNIVRHAIEFVCAVDAIPQSIDIDLSGFDIGDSIHYSALSIPDGVVPTITDRDFTIATIAAPTVAEEEETTDEEGEEGVEGEGGGEGAGDEETTEE
ncbi:MAG: 50S ribosomal protein L25/general stress protein Ctc [Rhodospirillaceae bacterium]|jgi:large subunit ribosomal protein L25|nr:50S ribosomal protein L25/general stress protein Ctc [Rhodospirillaceae bacterium]MBT5667526.1 50S ribosomal protein L25/general stress protein Ctc [Rhodospirillaceae bacterium]MBT5811470.1 50S ribosomal protein L25/general stress protein Ctc [Rhodospirillaceae bacterium]